MEKAIFISQQKCIEAALARMARKEVRQCYPKVERRRGEKLGYSVQVLFDDYSSRALREREAEAIFGKIQ